MAWTQDARQLNYPKWERGGECSNLGGVWQGAAPRRSTTQHDSATPWQRTAASCNHPKPSSEVARLRHHAQHEGRSRHLIAVRSIGRLLCDKSIEELPQV